MKNRRNPNQTKVDVDFAAKFGLNWVSNVKKSKEVINRFFFIFWMSNTFQRLNQYLTNINQYLMVQ